MKQGAFLFIAKFIYSFLMQSSNSLITKNKLHDPELKQTSRHFNNSVTQFNNSFFNLDGVFSGFPLSITVTHREFQFQWQSGKSDQAKKFAPRVSSLTEEQGETQPSRQKVRGEIECQPASRPLRPPQPKRSHDRQC